MKGITNLQISPNEEFIAIMRGELLTIVNLITNQYKKNYNENILL